MTVLRTFSFLELRPVRMAPVTPRFTQELEWSDFGRDSHLGPGWWLLPTVAAGLSFWIGLLSLIL